MHNPKATAAHSSHDETAPPGPARRGLEQRLALAGLPIVRAAARRAVRRLLPFADADELTSLGLTVLLDTMRRHDPARSRFSTHLRHRLRWLFGTAARRHRRERLDPRRGKPAAVTLRYEDTHGRRVMHRGSSLAECSPSLMNHVRPQDRGGQITPGGDLAATAMCHNDNPEQAALRRAATHQLHAALATLPERARTLLERHYFGDERFDHVAADLGISKFAASRLHKRAIRMMRNAFRRARAAEKRAWHERNRLRQHGVAHQAQRFGKPGAAQSPQHPHRRQAS